jgi:hypothetical protein
MTTEVFQRFMLFRASGRTVVGPSGLGLRKRCVVLSLDYEGLPRATFPSLLLGPFVLARLQSTLKP